MQRAGVHFGGTRSPRVLEAIARDGVASSERTLVALDIEGTRARGLVVAFARSPRRYWRDFAPRHPRVALEIATHRVRRELRRRFRRPDEPAARDDGTRSQRVSEARALIADRIEPRARQAWSDDDPRIAKVMYVAVDPAARQGGVGTELYRWFFRELARRGFVRCDAQVSEDNVGAVQLHRRFPFVWHESPGGYFLWLDPKAVA